MLVNNILMKFIDELKSDCLEVVKIEIEFLEGLGGQKDGEEVIM